MLENRPENSEVIVVHRGAYDDPYELRREVLLVEHDTDATLSELLNRGLEVAGGEVLHLLACGATVAEGWAEHARSLLADDLRLGSVTPLLTDVQRPERLVNTGVAFGATGGRQVVGRGRRTDRPATHAWGPSLSAGFYRLGAVRDVGGFADRLGDLVDVDVAASLRTAGYKTQVDRQTSIAMDASVQPEDSPEPRAVRIGQAERMYRRHASQLGWSTKFSHTAVAAGGGLFDLVTGKVSCVTARLAAVLDRRSRVEHAGRVATAAERCGQDPVLLSLEDERRRRQGGASRRKAA